MEFEKFEKFLKDNDVYKEFYQEFIYSEDGIDLSEETDDNVYVEAHRNAKENLQDIILTEGIKEVLSNGFIFFYEGNNKNTITDVEWKDIFEEYGEEKSTEDIEQYYVIPLDFQLTENAFCHKANIDEIELNQIIIYINQKYIVTSKNQKNQTLEARLILKNYKLSKNKYIMMSDKTVDKKTYRQDKAIQESTKKILEEKRAKEEKPKKKRKKNLTI